MMDTGSCKQPKRTEARWFNTALAAILVACCALAVVVGLIAVDMRALLNSHQADQRKLEAISAMKDAIALSIAIHSEEELTLQSRPTTAIATQRAVTDEALTRLTNDISVSNEMAGKLGVLAAGAQHFLTDLRNPLKAANAASHDDFAQMFDAMRAQNLTVVEDMLRDDIANDTITVAWLAGLGLLAMAALLVVIGLACREFKLRRNTLKDVAQARRAVVIAERARARFLQAIGHDLRQPLQAMMLFATGLERHARDDHAQQLLANLQTSLDSMRRMLGGLIDTSRLDAGVVTAAPIVLPVAEILHPLMGEFGALAAAKGIVFTIQPTPLAVRTDPVMLECVLRNLVSNAVRFTRAGEVAIHCRSEGDNCLIDITDSGPGIAENEKMQIFQEFYRVAGTAQQADGLGLGLAIVKRIVDLLGITIELESIPGHGTIFTITLPLAHTDAAQAPRLLKPRCVDTDLSGIRVLLIENDEAIAQALVPELTSRGMSVMTQKNGEAVCALFARDEPPIFDILLVDQELGTGMTGSQLLDNLAMRFHIALPAVLLSGTTDFHVIRELQNSEYPWLAKPVRLPTLLREMRRVLDLGAPASLAA